MSEVADHGVPSGPPEHRQPVRRPGGRDHDVARARATMASRLATSAAHLTTSADALEDRVTAIGRASERFTPTDRPRLTAEALGELDAIDKVLASDGIPSSDREVLYHERLQIERDLRAKAHAIDPMPPADDGPLRTLGASADEAARPPDETVSPAASANGSDRTRPLNILDKGSVDL